MAGKQREAMMKKHGMCFAAVAVITQLKIMARETIFEVDYDVHYSWIFTTDNMFITFNSWLEIPTKID